MSDKRSVTTDALETLGTIISTNEKRDAIHLGVEPVVAAQRLKPGQHVGFKNGKNGIVGVCNKTIGIVDPFLASPVEKGEMFWLIVYPRKITSLRHVWTHPDFPAADSADISSSEAALTQSKSYIAELANDVGISYQRLIDGAEAWLESNTGNWGGDYITGGAEMEGMGVPDEFWDHYEIVTGRDAPHDLRGSFFSCSC